MAGVPSGDLLLSTEAVGSSRCAPRNAAAESSEGREGRRGLGPDSGCTARLTQGGHAGPPNQNATSCAGTRPGPLRVASNEDAGSRPDAVSKMVPPQCTHSRRGDPGRSGRDSEAYLEPSHWPLVAEWRLREEQGPPRIPMSVIKHPPWTSAARRRSGPTH